MGGTTFSSIKPALTSILSGKDVNPMRDFRLLEHSHFDNVSMGTKPSGTLHMGNLFVLASCMHYLRVNSSATVHVDIMDLDFNSHGGALFIPFINLPGTKEFITQLDAAVGILSRELVVGPERVKIRYFSDKLKESDSKLRRMFLGLAKDKETADALKYCISDGPGRRHAYPPGCHAAVPISMICPGCGQSNSNFAHYNPTRARFTAQCYNPGCAVGEYASDLSSELFNVYYLSQTVRDLLLPSRTIHIYGGDYDMSHGKSNASRFMRAAAIVEATKLNLGLATGMPSFFITPMITNRDGTKISKSACNRGPACGNLVSHLRDEIAHVVKLMQSCVDGTFAGPILTASGDNASCAE